MRLIAVVACCIIACGQCLAMDLSAPNYVLWPAKAQRPALPADAAPYLAPPGTVTSVMHSTGRVDKGTNSKSMWMIAAPVTLSDGTVIMRYHRKKSCGNPATGSNVISRPQPRQAYVPPPAPAPTPPPPTEEALYADNSVPVVSLGWSAPQALPTSQVGGYKIESSRPILNLLVGQQQNQVVQPPTSPYCPPPGPGDIPVPPPGNGSVFPQYPSHGTGGQPWDPSPSSPHVADPVH